MISMNDSHTHGESAEMIEGGEGRDDAGGCLLAVGARRARWSNKFSSVHNGNAIPFIFYKRRSR